MEKERTNNKARTTTTITTTEQEQVAPATTHPNTTINNIIKNSFSFCFFCHSSSLIAALRNQRLRGTSPLTLSIPLRPVKAWKHQRHDVTFIQIFLLLA
jgi:hypothetical protein